MKNFKKRNAKKRRNRETKDSFELIFGVLGDLAVQSFFE
jgi:hypothetical protein